MKHTRLGSRLLGGSVLAAGAALAAYAGSRAAGLHPLGCAGLGLGLGSLAGTVALAPVARIAGHLSRRAAAFSSGSSTFSGGGIAELDAVAAALSRMAESLAQRDAQLQFQRQEWEAVVDSMEEGMVAVDDADRIIGLNRGAEGMLGLVASQARSRPVREAIPAPELHRLLSAINEGATAEEETIRLEVPRPALLAIRGAPLRGQSGDRIGAVILLTNVTRLRRLEDLRKELVANVSHELRTPVTSIRGFAETLLDGAIEDPQQARHFVEIIDRQASRLSSIIADLLTLADLDRAVEVETAPVGIPKVISRALEACHALVNARAATVEVECPEGLSAPANSRLLEQAVTNLVENAVRYGGGQVRVRIEAFESAERVHICVSDNGPGIAADHLPRLFERFYRADRGRASEMGGTGLGLSIVRHVARIHGGEASAESELGRGSAFTVSIPAAPLVLRGM